MSLENQPLFCFADTTQRVRGSIEYGGHLCPGQPDNFRSASSTNSTYVVWYNQFDIWRHWICSVMLPTCTVCCLNLLTSTFQMMMACQLFGPRSNFCILISFEQGALWICMTTISTKKVFEASSSARARLLADTLGGTLPRHRYFQTFVISCSLLSSWNS